jgi:hypothetical protein
MDLLQSIRGGMGPRTWANHWGAAIQFLAGLLASTNQQCGNVGIVRRRG